MRSNDSLFEVAHPEFYETLDQYAADDAPFIAPVRAALPDAWRTARNGPWLHASPPNWHSPHQGWKIHLSATAQSAEALLAAVVPVLVSRAVSFKFALDRRLLHMLNGKQWSRGHSGKFVTIYPRDEREFLELLPVFAERTRGHAGPYILSDRRYRDSKVVF